ncbi:TerB family tellurite resistance protein [Fulvivirga ulvae]|uniref:TerB family tellurite resistance protein n=1 Tax=Fulvivirga ulvae TaxID=2904245 RepID=UPI001F3B8578|nr:TerB family tellurite resistance protein [Fulvivirga ulvae]UII32513.1 TerB family tellurite resistance protein [Fulvivirga ulvae]
MSKTINFQRIIRTLMDIVTRKQLNILIQLAEADKHFSVLERDRIYEIAAKRNFPIEGVKELIQNPEPIGSFGALSNDQKFDYLYSCIDLMLIDEKIFDSELIFCIDIAIKLGFKKDVVTFLKDEIHSYPMATLKQIVFERYT